MPRAPRSTPLASLWCTPVAEGAADPGDGPSDVPPLPFRPPVDPALGGPLLVAPRGSGGVAVTTDALQAHAEQLRRLRDTLEGDTAALAGVHPPTADQLAIASPQTVHAVRQLGPAHVLLRGVAVIAAEADDRLRAAIVRYAEAEQRERQRAIALGAQLAVLLGPVLRVLVVLALPAVLAARVTGFPAPAQLAALKQWMLAHPGTITSPAFVEAVRITAMSLDEAAGSLTGLPPGAATALAHGGGFVGVQAGAAYVLGAGRPFGLFREGPITVERVAESPVSAPAAGSAERLGRVPEGDQVRIERYDAPGRPPRYVVYVGPTETFSPIATDEPWDLTSNVYGVAGLDAGSIRATQSAMRDAGITAEDQIQLVGFSQGGMVASRIAASGDWNVVGLETYGAPAGDILLPEGLSGMAVRNTDDFIPALAGPQLDDHLLQVERQAFAPGSPIPTELAAPAHQRTAYDATATVIDRASSAAVREQIAAMDEFTAGYLRDDGSRITAMVYEATRGGAKGLSSGGPAIR